MNYADIKTVDIQDGNGVRVSIYVSGCHFHCKGCHNQEAWDFKYGKEYTKDTEQYIIELLNHEYISGLSILGGEPLEFQNQKELANLAEKVKEVYPNKNIWCYTGYTWEELDGIDLSCIDVLVDGEFELNNRDITLAFRGSSNQRIIDVKASLDSNKVVLLNLEG